MSLEIMHIDMDAFYAAVEQLDNEDYRGKPVIVGGVGTRGVVSASSYEAREYGVYSAMPMVKAKKLCPQGIFLTGRMSRYQEISQKIFKIFYRFTPIVEKLSIDEGFLDLTGCHQLFGSSIEIGKNIKELIKQKIGITASVGLAPNKFLAKLASDLDKPDGFFVIKENEIAEILEPLPVKKIWGVGKKTEAILKEKGITTIAKLKKLSIEELKANFGQLGSQLYYLARGIDHRQVSINNEIKSISHEETFPEDLTDKDYILAALLDLSERVSHRLRKQNLEANTVFIKIRYSNFNTITRRITLSYHISSLDELYQVGKSFLQNEKLLTRPLRLLGIGVSNLQQNSRTQLSLFTKDNNKKELSKTIDGIKDRFGVESIKRARGLLDYHKKDN